MNEVFPLGAATAIIAGACFFIGWWGGIVFNDWQRRERERLDALAKFGRKIPDHDDTPKVKPKAKVTSPPPPPPKHNPVVVKVYPRRPGKQF